MTEEFEQVALDLFGKRGFANVSAEDIAETAGVTVRTFYRYFSSKEEVLAVYPRRLSERVWDAIKEEPTDRPFFDVFASALLNLAASMDPYELQRWWEVVTSDPSSLQSMVLNVFQLRPDMEPVFAPWMSDNPDSSLQFELVLGAGQSAIVAAATCWHTFGGDLVSWVERGLAIYAQGLATQPGRRRQRSRAD
jgi:TetR/AcrR family transcriptional regulator, regulator of mycofactocin system